ncbi:unnamed protein product [Phytophthora fragariaefolia]|uniref:Unnamed protein product n=1 Tax=Phytophthora fragariaefolia TaxID=1490495 RepID=A0A9W6XM39_9STRA|nr:unnamed protein product [Phytophthora fragariaefolia]
MTNPLHGAKIQAGRLMPNSGYQCLLTNPANVLAEVVFPLSVQSEDTPWLYEPIECTACVTAGTTGLEANFGQSKFMGMVELIAAFADTLATNISPISKLFQHLHDMRNYLNRQRQDTLHMTYCQVSE